MVDVPIWTNFRCNEPGSYPGQVTDDTELAVSLAYGLIDIVGQARAMTRKEPSSGYVANRKNRNNADAEETDESAETEAQPVKGLYCRLHAAVKSRPIRRRTASSTPASFV